MSVKSSFLILTMLAFLLCIGFELANWSYQREEVNDMAKQNAEELVEGFKQLLSLKSDLSTRFSLYRREQVHSVLLYQKPKQNHTYHLNSAHK